VPLKVKLDMNAVKLPFDDQLRDSLPLAWQKSWAILNPTGSSDVKASILVMPGGPDQYHIEIDPRPETNVRLAYSRAPRPGIDPGGTFDLRMEKARGRFVFHNGVVSMEDVGFQFYRSPVRFARGQLVVEDSGKFQLGVEKVWAQDFRLDQEIRKIMPPVMAQFARRLDDGHSFPTIKGNLGIQWSGKPGDPVTCRWDNTLVVLNDNSIQAGLPLEHLQGQLDNVAGWSNGDTLNVQGALRLESVSLLGQQVTELESPFRVTSGRAELSNIQGKLLGGVVAGTFGVTLAATPRYGAHLSVDGADLQRYASTLPGRQSFRGQVFGRLDLEGMGNDLHQLQGRGEAHVVQGNLGELPILLRLLEKMKLSAPAKTAFDAADIAITIKNGESVLNPIRLTGNTVSLVGDGTLDTQGELDLRLTPIYGRDRMRVPVLSNAMREASGQLLGIRVQGPVAYPRFKLMPLPGVSDGIRSISTKRTGWVRP
jgi:hypothetical protein